MRYLSDISEHWTVSRMPLVDRNILRLAVYEILFVEDIPDSVSINEAVEMAKSYGGEDSSKFVNGVLGRLAEIRSDDMKEHERRGWLTRTTPSTQARARLEEIVDAGAQQGRLA